MPDIFVAMRNWRISRMPGPKRTLNETMGRALSGTWPGGWISGSTLTP